MNGTFAIYLFYFFFFFLQNNLFQHIRFQEGGRLPRTFSRGHGGKIEVAPLSLLLSVAYISNLIFLIMYGWKTHWWNSLIILFFGIIFTGIIFAIIKGAAKRTGKQPNLVWLTLVSIMGIPICVFFMFYYLVGKNQKTIDAIMGNIILLIICYVVFGMAGRILQNIHDKHPEKFKTKGWFLSIGDILNTLNSVTFIGIAILFILYIYHDIHQWYLPIIIFCVGEIIIFLLIQLRLHSRISIKNSNQIIPVFAGFVVIRFALFLLIANLLMGMPFSSWL